MEIEKCTSKVFIERNRLVKMSCAQGRGTSRLVTIETYRVLAMFDKNYKKWFVSKDDKKAWHKKMPKGKFKTLARKMIANGPTLEEEDITSRKNVSIGTIFALRDAV